MPKSAPKKKVFRKRTELRYLNEEHHKLIADAAKKVGLSINAWSCTVTLAAARKELGRD